MHIRSVSYLLSHKYEIVSVADEFVEFTHTDGSPFQPAEVWGKGVWAHIQHCGLVKTFHSLFFKARRRPLSLPFRLDSTRNLKLWQIEAEAAGENLLVSFQHLAQKPRPHLPEGQVVNKPSGQVDCCGWCNRVTRPGGKPEWLTLEESEYMEVLESLSKSAVRYKLCDECTRGLIHSHEPKYFAHLSLGTDVESRVRGTTLHRQLTAQGEAV
ncbi:hypothetical protein JST97_18915 [bacterium]|nr:hypothetical protein [bacterium]